MSVLRKRLIRKNTKIRDTKNVSSIQALNDDKYSDIKSSTKKWNWMSYFFFMYAKMDDIIYKANKSELEADDFKFIDQQYLSQNNLSKMENSWEKLYNNSSKNSKSWFFFKVLLYGFCKEYIFIVIPLRFIPRFMDLFALSISSQLLSYAVNMEYGYNWLIYGTILSFIMFFLRIIQRQARGYVWNIWEVTTYNSTRLGIISFVYTKMLKLSNSSMKDVSAGKIMGLIGYDLDKINSLFWIIKEALVRVLSLVYTLYFLYKQLGYAMLYGIIVQVIMCIGWTYCYKQMMELHQSRTKARDKRLKTSNEVLKNVRVIKMYGWVECFINKIGNLRIHEINLYEKSQYLNKMWWVVYVFIPILMSIVSFSMYVKNGTLTVEKAFVSMALFGKISDHFIKIPVQIKEGFKSWLSLTRIADFLFLSERINNIETKSDIDRIYISGSFYWDDECSVTALNNIDIQFKKGSLSMIIGETSSGKTGLIKSLLGNMNTKNGKIIHPENMRIGYMSQISWILNDTIKNNIVFGSKYNDILYNKCIDICCLTDDLKGMVDGDKTMIGSQGVNLSGGQKQRLSMARCMYMNADLYILDDPFSNVDSKVGNNIFKKCILNWLIKNGKTVIISTHSLSYLNYADNIIVMNKGAVEKQGKLDDIINANVSLSKFAVTKDLEEHVSEPTNTSEGETNDDTKEPETNKKDNEGKKVTKKEEKKDETFSFDSVKLYARVSYGYYRYIAFLVVALGYLLFDHVFSMVWLGKWSENTDNKDSEYYIKWYSIIRFTGMGFLFIQMYFEISSRVNAAKYFHNKLLDRILHGPMEFFDITPTGKLSSLFSHHINRIDDSLCESFKDSARSILQVLCGSLLILTIVPQVLLVLIPVSIGHWITHKYYQITKTPVEEMKSKLNPPVFSHFNESYDGINIIQCHNQNQRFINKQCQHLDNLYQIKYGEFLVWRTREEFQGYSSNILALSASLACVFIKPESSKIGIVLTLVLNIIDQLNWVFDKGLRLSVDIMSLEKVINYYDDKNFKIERNIIGKSIGNVDIKDGSIEFRNVWMKYRDELPYRLKGMNFKVNCGDKIGIMGKTGAGKSSIFMTLLRMVEIESKNDNDGIFIDGINVQKIELHKLRSIISVIPQDPILFHGDIRFNLNPFNPTTLTLIELLHQHNMDNIYQKLLKNGIETVQDIYSSDMKETIKLKEYLIDYDNKLINVLQLSNLYDILKHKNNGNIDNILDTQVNENGTNFSVGERQLLCLSRAILRESKILILDEATSSVDANTDLTIQNTIRKVFKNNTILTIAHRINTILDYDKILIINDGHNIEYDSPKNLLKKKSESFMDAIKHTFGNDIDSIQKHLNKKKY